MEKDMTQDTSKPSVETKSLGGHIVETKVSERNGVPVGLIEGYIATWEPDTGGVFGMPDQFLPGAFTKSLQEHLDRGNRPIRLKDHHGRVVGAFPIETVREDEVGLFGIGEINLETQQGREAFALIRQGALSDLSIGFSAKRENVTNGIRQNVTNGIRQIPEAVVWEGSVIDEPANRGAQILGFKGAFQDLPLAPATWSWTGDSQVRDQIEAAGIELKSACVGEDLLIADMVKGELHAIPEQVQAQAETLSRADGPKDPELVRHLERYLAKMGAPSPFEQKDRQFWGVDECRTLGPREIENALATSGAFSKGAARVLAARLKSADEEGGGTPEPASTPMSEEAAQTIRELNGDAMSEEAAGSIRELSGTCYPVGDSATILRDLEDSTRLLRKG